MLKKHQRISKADLALNEFPFHFYKTPLFSFKVRKNTLGTIRYACIVSKKIDKRAVVRNTLKRKMYVAVEGLSTEGSYDMVFFLRKELATATGEVIQQTLQQSTSRIKI